MTASYDAKHKQAVLSGRAVRGRSARCPRTDPDRRAGRGHEQSRFRAGADDDAGGPLLDAARDQGHDRLHRERRAGAAAVHGAVDRSRRLPLADGRRAGAGVRDRLRTRPPRRCPVVHGAGQALAARELPRSSELPAGANAVGPGYHLCDGKHPSEAKLTVTGEAQSPSTSRCRGDRAATPRTSARSRSRRRRASTGPRSRRRPRSRGRRRSPPHAVCSAGARAPRRRARPRIPRARRRYGPSSTRIDFQGPTGTMEIVFLQRGRSVAKLIVVGINTPSRPLALALERSLAARLR